jgi:kynurenine formamidase
VTRVYDLSLPIDDAAPEPFPVTIERTGHAEGAGRVGRKFDDKIDRDSFPDSMFLSHETVTASVHCGTHVDAPFHFGPVSEGEPARTIDEVPLDWFYGNGVVLDVTHVISGGEITPEDINASLTKIECTVKPGDVVLLMTGADRYFGTKEYFTNFPGLGAKALDALLDMGVKTIGIDALGLDRPFGVMVDEYYKTKDKNRLWPAHLLGRKREYCHIERLANLASLPRPFGFKFASFPVKIKGAGAAWSRAVAIFED